MQFVRIEQTSEACPSQWNAWTADGVYHYVRYRHGDFTVSRGGVVVAYRRVERVADGVMDANEMVALCAELLS